MATDETEIPPAVRDILSRMPREMRARVLGDYESHYAPFLAMLAGWKASVQTHYTLAESSAVARLEEQFFPLGSWRFPAQTLAVPARPVERTTEVLFDSPFVDPTNRAWLACGAGWLQPTTARDADMTWQGEAATLIVNADYAGGGQFEAVMARGQLAFMAAPEEVVAAMESARWWVETQDETARPVTLTRFDGYMAFEREMQTARMSQRQLDLWLPPFFPYARKIVCWRLSDEDDGAAPPSVRGAGADGFRLIGRLDKISEKAARFLRDSNALRVHFNAVPVVQTALGDNTFYPPFPRVGNDYALRLAGAPDIFAAVALHDGRPVPTSLVRVPSSDPAAREPDAQVQFAQSGANVARVKLYWGAKTAGRTDEDDTPTTLDKTPLRFAVPYPMVGGANVGGPQNRADWVRTAWYQSVLRPPLLTEGDLRELLAQRQQILGDILQFQSASREIVQEIEPGAAHWRSYLWPSVLAREDGFDARAEEIPAPDSVPLIQRLRVAFARGPAASRLPDFLLADAAHYLASTLSQYFVLSCFRVEGELVE